MPSRPPRLRAGLEPGGVFHAHTKPETRHFWLRLSAMGEEGKHTVEIHNIDPREAVDPRRRTVHEVNVELMGSSEIPILRVRPSEPAGSLPTHFRDTIPGFLSLLEGDYEHNPDSTTVAADRKVAFIIGRRPGAKRTWAKPR